MLRQLALPIVGYVLTGAVPAGAVCAPTDVQMGINAQGYPTERWLDAIRDRMDAASVRRIATTKGPLSEAQEGWAKVARNESSQFCSNIERINAAFPSVQPPARLHVLLGTQSGDDAFTFGSDTIVLDMSAFEKAYGPSQNQDALVRQILSHEYTHLLIHTYLDRRGWTEEWAAGDPYLKAIRVLFNEGIANLSSIQDPKWVSNGEPTQFARQAVAKLEPTLLGRLQILERHPTADVAAQAMRNISQGDLTDKWGAIPIAVWLQVETHGSPEKLQRWIERGPDEILDLAARNAGPDRRNDFQHLLAALPSHIRSRPQVYHSTPR